MANSTAVARPIPELKRVNCGSRFNEKNVMDILSSSDQSLYNVRFVSSMTSQVQVYLLSLELACSLVEFWLVTWTR